MAFYLIGARGRLGKAIAAEYASSGIISLDRTIYQDWSEVGAVDLVSRYFEEHSDEKAAVFVASGLLDPRLSQEELLKVNFTLAKNVIDGATKLGIKVITFGTVMEGLMQTKNPYIQSKTALSEYVGSVTNENKPAIHIQLHTLYGHGLPSSFMFLGQMLAAMKTDQLFKMTSGRQLREYHHLADDAIAIRKITNSFALGIFNLSHGKPLSLKSIADNVFAALGKSHLLRVGALPEPPGENYDKILQPTEIVQRVSFRNSLPAIIEYMQDCYFCEEEKA